MMDAKTLTQAAAPVPAVPAPIRHADPKTGGSYTRNLVTGALVKNAAPAAQPKQE
ncbi:hypothetical protein [Janthinobacterium sp. HLX7-2]|uniref:hypothetical protein n=1 Tax=Janthinobacterium sp. HLX7-2 TaxID=1259331 RepID=UPI003F2999AF